jgi:hypothetical protein
MPLRSPRRGVFVSVVFAPPEVVPEEPKGGPPPVAFWFLEHPARRSAKAVTRATGRAKGLKRGFV